MNENPAATAPSVRELAKTFIHLGLTAYGGLAMVEPIRQRIVKEKGWLNQKEFLDGLALCQIVPGATVVQLATYVGYRLRRTSGALAAAAGFIFPAFVLMLGLSFLYFTYGNIAWVKSVSRGLGAVVIALLLQAVWHLGQNIKRHRLDLGIAFLALAALWFRANYLLVFAGAGLLRLSLSLRQFPDRVAADADLPGQKPPVGLILGQLALTLTVLAVLVRGLRYLAPKLGLMAETFLKIAVVAFGGGYAMIPILQWDLVDHLGWLTLRQFLDGILLGFVTPGPIIITATFVGYRVQGLLGAVVATAAVFLPPILIIIFLSPFYHRIKEARLMRPVIQGILAALVGMLVLVTVQMGAATLTDVKSLALMAAASLALIAFRVDLLWIVAAAAGLSLFLF
ncbi:MAG: chromate efflux transporter [Syntrophobacterales bacterium]|jgi:chromate transporter|nr:chromate efflux transporter [Syntrophobacterales bacterium]